MSPMRMSKVESAIRAALDFNQAFNRHDVAAMLLLVSEDCVFEHFFPLPDGSVYQGKAAVAGFLEEFLRQYPQARNEVEDAHGFGERCILRWILHWEGAAGESKHLRGMDFFRVEDQVIHEKLSYVKGSAV